MVWPWFCSSAVCADKRHVAPSLNFVNFTNLNKVLRFEVFASKDRQLRAVHLILDFKPLSNNFQDMGHIIRAGDPRLRRINVSIPGFLAREDMVPVELPFHHSPHEVVVPREETTSSRLSLKAEIDQFHLEEDRRTKRTYNLAPRLRGQARQILCCPLPQAHRYVCRQWLRRVRRDAVGQ